MTLLVESMSECLTRLGVTRTTQTHVVLFNWFRFLKLLFLHVGIVSGAHV